MAYADPDTDAPNTDPSHASERVTDAAPGAAPNAALDATPDAAPGDTPDAAPDAGAPDAGAPDAASNAPPDAAPEPKARAAPVTQFNDTPNGAWTTGLFACFDDWESCCCTLWCPCVTVGRVVDIVSRGKDSFDNACAFWCCLQYCLCAGCFYSYEFRGKMRETYDLPGDPTRDLLLHWCCILCSTTQEYRELRNRGWNVKDTYQENIVRHRDAASKAPQDQSMSKE